MLASRVKTEDSTANDDAESLLDNCLKDENNYRIRWSNRELCISIGPEGKCQRLRIITAQLSDTCEMEGRLDR